MKPIVIALGICALLVAAAAPARAAVRTWDAGHPTSDAWSVPLNWSGNTVPVCATDDAVIEMTGANCPTLDGVVDRGVQNLKMHDASELHTNGNTLRVIVTFTVEPNGEAPNVLINGGGGITANTIVIKGDVNYGAVLTVAAGTTVQTGSPSCP